MSAAKTIRIRDPVYGFIELSDQEREIINSRHFQRLRRIKQLALTDMVYPGASHTRFEHSIGVMQMASDMFDNLAKMEDNRNSGLMPPEERGRLKKIIRMAALLHDIGHAPFSHAGEKIMPKLPKNHPDYSPPKVRSNKKKKHKKYEHEHYTHEIIRCFFADIIENHSLELGITVDDVLLLLGDKKVKKTPAKLLILKEMISGQLDADRADYLLRDSLHIGVNYGLYDRHMLVNCITLAKHEETGSDVLAIDEKGWRIAESLVVARYQMFSQIYFHKTRRIFDHHISTAMLELLKNTGFKDNEFPPPTSEQNLIEYLRFDDWHVYAAIKDEKCGEHGTHILHRTPYKTIMEWKDVQEETIKKEEKKYRRKYKHKQLHTDDNVSTTWYKPEKDIHIRTTEGGISELLSKRSQIVKYIGQPKITRLYASRD
jgi:HD superfamily phosphohydrolase